MVDGSMSGPSKVIVTEVGPRDGFQIEHDFIPTATKIALINQLIEAGVPRIEFSSFVSPRAVPQLADAAEVLAGIDRSRGTELVALVPNAKGAARAIEAGADALCVFVSASETHNRKNVNRTVEELLAGFVEVMQIANRAGTPVHGAIATAFGCPFEGDVPVKQVGRIAERFRALGMVGVNLGDTTGMATPPLVVERCRHLKEHVPELPITLHFHNTRGVGLVNVAILQMLVLTSLPGVERYLLATFEQRLQTSTLKGICRRSLDILDRTVMVPTHPLYSDQEIRDTIHNIEVAARVVLGGMSRDEADLRNVGQAV